MLTEQITNALDYLNLTHVRFALIEQVARELGIPFRPNTTNYITQLLNAAPLNTWDGEGGRIESNHVSPMSRPSVDAYVLDRLTDMVSKKLQKEDKDREQAAWERWHARQIERILAGRTPRFPENFYNLVNEVV